MKIYILSFIIVLTCSGFAWAQNETAARKHYLKAENAFLKEDLATAQREIVAAEKELGRVTPRVQFLKVLIYEKLALANVTMTDAAMTEINRYLAISNLPPVHQKYKTEIQQIARTLPNRAQAAHTAREEKRKLEEKIAWQTQAQKFRLGFGVGTPSSTWLATELTLLLGSRSSLWMIGASTNAGTYLSLEEDFHMEILDKLNASDDARLHTSIVHVGYLQGIRVLPRERDFIKPMIGGRLIYHGELAKIFKARNSSQEDPTPETIKKAREYGLDPRHFYKQETSFRSGVSFDVVVGAMAHFGITTFYAGMDVINSKRAQFGVAFKLGQ